MKCTNCTNGNASKYVWAGITSYLCDNCRAIIEGVHTAHSQTVAATLTLAAIRDGMLHGRE